MEVGIAIQQAYEKQRPWVDLTPIGFSYIIDFSTMGQINRQTQRQRRVRRRLDLVYPMVAGSLPKPQSWPLSPASPTMPPGPPCTCPQCVLVMSVKAAVAHGGSAPQPSTATRKNTAAPSGATKPPPASGPGAKLPDGVGTVRGLGKPAPVQAIRRQATSTGTGTPAGSPASASGADSRPGRAALATLNRNSLQRLAIAQSRVLIASGVPTVPVKNLNGSSPVNPALAGITGILMSAAGLPVCLTRPPKLVLHPPPVSKSEIKSIPGVSNMSRKTTKKQAKKGKAPEEVLKKYLQKVRHPPEEDCTICMERLTAPSGYKGPQPTVKPDVVGKLSRCGHVYHIYCLVAMYNNGNKDGSLQCPTCKTIYGVKTGTQPPGKMEYHLIPHSLPGHPDCKTIRIIYSIPPGIQVRPRVLASKTRSSAPPSGASPPWASPRPPVPAIVPTFLEPFRVLCARLAEMTPHPSGFSTNGDIAALSFTPRVLPGTMQPVELCTAAQRELPRSFLVCAVIHCVNRFIQRLP
ncbi:E3 ubiquitin-protein ligase DTX4-like [Octodon degus]|uniref:E3 ubiquitin-protein ligase n=1 Tax=Octodon degus TaxID=10160 RepID=A0A6P6DPH0_OCTDE|nr:E3 ubiquitin-protein ligase DTX4-like [Octodon degus]